MGPLARLLQPYTNAIQGVPTTSATISRDPLLSLLQPAVQSSGGPISPLSPSTSEGGLHPVLQQLMSRLPWLDIVSGVRSTERQQELWEQALAKYGDPEIADNWVARPGTSQHEVGNAIDVAGEDIARLVSFLSSHPKWDARIGRPMSHEPWHFQPTGTF